MCIWGHRKLSYKRHRIIPFSKKLLHVRWSWKVTSVWIKHSRNFEQGLVLIHCLHSSGGCWLPDNGFVGIRGLSLERLCTLLIWWMLTETTIDSVWDERLTGQTRLISSCNVKHGLESLLEQIGFPSLLSLMRFITFSPPRTRSKPPSLEALYSFPPFTL